MTKETFVAYWGGYFNSPLTLDKIPDYIDVVILAFASPTPIKSRFSTKLQFVQSTSFAGWSSQPA